MTPDSELLRRYAETNSQDAFAELVQRHVNLVYSAAWRQVNGNAHLAEDVAQTVFTDLARKANSLSRRESLTGWIYSATHFAAAKIVRGENRRRDREEKFMREPTSETAPETDWEKLCPTLDDAMHELKETDREAVLLRYFENWQFAEVGVKLGLNENAARMRVERALEKLRAIFTKRGITTATALASVISANAVQLAPANLAATLTTTSIAAVGTGTFTILKIMTATKLKLAFSALVVAGATTAFVIQHQTQEKLSAENELLTQQIVQLQTDNESLSNRLATIGDSKSFSDEQMNELLKLRGEVTLLRQRQSLLQLVPKSETNNTTPVAPFQIHVKAYFFSVPANLMAGMSAIVPADATGIMLEENAKIARQAIEKSDDTIILAEPEVVTTSGRQTQMRASQPVLIGGTNIDVGVKFGMIPNFSTNSSTFDLSFDAELTQLTGDVSQPDVEAVAITNQITLALGQTLFLEKEISNGWLPGMTNEPSGPRKLLIFVTPTVVDLRGNRINFP